MPAGKVMALFFGMQECCWCSMLIFWDNYEGKIKQIWRGKPGNCPPHTSRNVDSNLLNEHPPYSLDLALSDYYLFPKMKKELGGHPFARYDDVMNAVDHFLRAQNGTVYTEGIRLLHDRWTKCVNAGGDYVEK